MNPKALFCTCLLFALPAFAEAPFSVTAPAGPTDGDLVTELQNKAVVDFLQHLLGSRYEAISSRVTPEFARRYILDYSLGHPAGNRSVTVLSGHLDADGLKRWSRMTEAKRGGTGMKVLFLYASSVPGLPGVPGNTATVLRESTAASTLFAEGNGVFRKFNTRATPASNAKLSLSLSPRTQAELHQLQEYGISEGYNVALWVQLTQCRGCSTVRLDTLLYSLGGPRLVASRSDDLGLSPSELGRSERLRSAAQPAFEALRADLETQASEGTLFISSYRLVVDGIDSPRAMALLDAGLGRADFVDQSVLKRSEPQLAEFEVMSSLKSDELYQRLSATDLGGFHLKPVRIDPQALVMRYSR